MNQKILISSSLIIIFALTELKDQLSAQADKSQQAHVRLYGCDAVIKTDHSSEQNSAFTSRQCGQQQRALILCLR